MADADKTALDAAQARYAAERTKRLRVDGNEQYSELAGTFADFDTDPYVEQVSPETRSSRRPRR